jgi:hypothetical protein
MFVPNKYDPDFDVLSEKEEWDKETREVVMSRVSAPPAALVLRQHEVDALVALFSVLLGDDRMPILQFVIDHFDTEMRIHIGESQRKLGMPPFPVLVHKGIDALNGYAIAQHNQAFAQLTPQTRWDLVNSLLTNPVPFQMEDKEVQSKDFLSRIHTEAVSAYYSHPTVWSEIGYAGPAYPRGYVRVERGLRDPWEAKSRHEKD